MFGSTRAATLVQDTLLAGNAAGIAATKQVLTGITAAIRTSVGPLDAMVETMLDPTARLDAYVKERKRTRVGSYTYSSTYTYSSIVYCVWRGSARTGKER